MTLDEKALEAAVTAFNKFGSNMTVSGPVEAAIRAYLEAVNAEPVGYVDADILAKLKRGDSSFIYARDRENIGIPLYTRPAPAHAVVMPIADAHYVESIVQPLDDIYVCDGFCDWADVATARDEIRRRVEVALSSHETPVRETQADLPITGETQVPDGWQLVPKEPTPEMLGAFYRQKNAGTQEVGLFKGERDFSDYAAYRATLAAAPTHGGSDEA